MVNRSRILIVDDSASDRRFLRRVVESLFPAKIAEAESGEEALEKFREEQYNVVICDYVMAGLNGLDVLEAVRNEKPETCRILLTGHASFDVAHDAINRAGVHAFLQKPVDPAALVAAVPLALERARREAAR